MAMARGTAPGPVGEPWRVGGGRGGERASAAGRVQPVALRLVGVREIVIEAFAPEAYWAVGAGVMADAGASFTVRLGGLDGEVGAGVHSQGVLRDQRVWPLARSSIAMPKWIAPLGVVATRRSHVRLTTWP